MNLRQEFRVTRGNAYLTCYPYKRGWRYCRRGREGEKWRYTTCTISSRPARFGKKRISGSDVRELIAGGE